MKHFSVICRYIDLVMDNAAGLGMGHIIVKWRRGWPVAHTNFMRELDFTEYL